MRFKVIDRDPLLELSRQVAKFVRDVVPQEPNTPALKAAHEAAEFARAPSAEEAADVLICLLGWAELNGLSAASIVAEAEVKMQINLARTWELQQDGTWQHFQPSDAA